MSDEVSKSWYTKHRPRTMEEYSGEQIKNLVNKRFVNRGNMPHCIYIRGPRGTGKTTLARILTKYYLCESPLNTGEPCEECQMCQSINEILIDGNSTDTEVPGVLEVDATTANGKEAIQEVIDDAIQPPLYTEYKIIIFDECHMITPAAQNALLKIIEDIPKHLVCMFCTTNDEKVLQTIKSRMQLTVEARKQTVESMANRLMVIAQKEGLTISKEALQVISKKGDRVPRECINLLENVALTYDRVVTIDNVKQLLGGIDSEQYLEFFKAANTSLSAVMIYMQSLKEKDIKLIEFISGISGFVMDALYIKHGIALEEYPTEYTKAIKQLFDMYDSNDFDLLMQIIEYLTSKSYIDNDKQLQMYIVTTAMRIAKIHLLANGLAEEQHEAIVENKRSLYEHSQQLKRDHEVVAEKLKIDLDIGELKEDFEGLTVVKDSAGLLDNIQIPDIPQVEAPEQEDNTEDNTGENADSFFDDL